MLDEAVSQNKKDEIVDACFVLGINLDIGTLVMSCSIPFLCFYFSYKYSKEAGEMCVRGTGNKGK